ncbi:hypothetical protein [Solemya velum gill symbiont]|uniref:hypothetical protein n=1 Tax=Solemya velum gill symbiont TaxID=2340 RepID=UPI0009973A90|nr:hypothetical protein [Solemya velum gill symbiont]OOZ43730.1 hypothetical protein BOW37_09415 [Solemya velum gill symbiont]OOZ45592.1 hypothetical protein BOW38_09510 [Solemya velum gill symbiont]OOZ48497.1 hypothetical protein BOW39_10475 [Solemya velum gill symbiont]OOZ50685.1 hypothetical protein BOW40_09865 [Solemya velum gill symbiont]OOZ53478.1 hypothetical protein BOW41_09730 [Solemya velum gill symbiont]
MTAPINNHRPTRSIPRCLKLAYTAFVAVLVPVYWFEYGPANFLWGSDIALLVTLAALWLESRLLLSMMTIAILIPEQGWCADLLIRLTIGIDAIEFKGTQYMFETSIPLFVRSLSLFHVALPVVLLWCLYRLGYHQLGLLGQSLLSWIVLPVSYLVSNPVENINWVYGFGGTPQTMLPEPLYVLLLMVLFPLLIYLPSHLVMGRLFSVPRGHSS